MEQFYYGNKLQFRSHMTNRGDGRRQAQVLGPLECTIADKLTRHTQEEGKRNTALTAIGKAVSAPTQKESNNTFKLNGELLHGGQGKDYTQVHVSCDRHDIPEHHMEEPHVDNMEGLQPPRLETTKGAVHGANKKQIRKENKKRRQQLKGEQTIGTQWATHQVKTPPKSAPTMQPPQVYQNSMCPSGRALAHPAAGLLNKWATLGCPTRTGRPWTKDEMWEAVDRGPHQSALSPEALAHFAEEATKKVRTKQARIVLWDDIKDNPPKQLKFSLIAAVPHKPKAFRSILDLSFRLRLMYGGILASVNDTTEKRAPKGAIDQIGDCLLRIIHAFAEADQDAKVFMAKWNIKDGFWHMDCEEGEEWNFAYVLPQLRVNQLN
jgi:hypothetical protein